MSATRSFPLMKADRQFVCGTPAPGGAPRKTQEI